MLPRACFWHAACPLPFPLDLQGRAMSESVQIQDPAGLPVPPRSAIWDLGFRPFFLLARPSLRVVDQCVGAAVRRLAGHAIPLGPAVACPRDGVRLCARRDGRLSVDGRSQLVEPAHADRPLAGRTCGAVGRRPRSGTDAVRHCRHSGQYRFPLAQPPLSRCRWSPAAIGATTSGRPAVLLAAASAIVHLSQLGVLQLPDSSASRSGSMSSCS